MFLLGDGVSPIAAFAGNSAKSGARIGLITDLHYADKPSPGSGHYRETPDKLAEAAERFHKEKSGFVVELRDFIDAADSVKRELGYLKRINRDFAAISKNRIVTMSTERQIVPGITLDASGQATVDPALADVLFDLAIRLEDPTNLPVDVEHVLAAIVLAARNGEVQADTALSSEDPALVDLLAVHVKTVFRKYGGKVGEDD